MTLNDTTVEVGLEALPAADAAVDRPHVTEGRRPPRPASCSWSAASRVRPACESATGSRSAPSSASPSRPSRTTYPRWDPGLAWAPAVDAPGRRVGVRLADSEATDAFAAAARKTLLPGHAARVHRLARRPRHDHRPDAHERDRDRHQHAAGAARGRVHRGHRDQRARARPAARDRDAEARSGSRRAASSPCWSASTSRSGSWPRCSGSRRARRSRRCCWSRWRTSSRRPRPARWSRCRCCSRWSSSSPRSRSSPPPALRAGACTVARSRSAAPVAPPTRPAPRGCAAPGSRRSRASASRTPSEPLARDAHDRRAHLHGRHARRRAVRSRRRSTA